MIGATDDYPYHIDGNDAHDDDALHARVVSDSRTISLAHSAGFFIHFSTITMNSPKPYVIYTDFGNDLPNGSVAAAIDKKHVEKTGCSPEILYDYNDVQHWSVPDGALHSSQIAKDWQHRSPVHVAVIDPTVGFASCERIAIETEQAGVLVGPNNGIFDLTVREFGVRFAAVIDDAFRTIPRSQSNTFDGRDLFAPAAAEIATGLDVRKIGQELPQEQLRALSIEPGAVIHADDFGNLKLWDCAHLRERIGETVAVSDQEGRQHEARVVSHHSEAKADDLIILPGSSGLAEIWVIWGSARERLRCTAGDIVRFDEEDSPKSVCPRHEG